MKHKTELIAKAQEYVFALFKEKLSPKFLYHNYKHTLEVVNTCQEIAEWYKLEKDEMEVLLLAAWFHDTGYAEAYTGHEEKSIEVARKFLLQEGFSPEKTEAVCKLVLSTNVHKKPEGISEEIMHDADYVTLGKKSFFEKAELLRIEWEVFLDKRYSDVEWANIQLDFLLENNFVTEYALKEYGNQRGKNVEVQRRKLEKLRASATKETDKGFKLSRGVETMYRSTYRNHINLSSMADSKANMMISINTIIMSVIISLFGSGVTFIGKGNFDHMRFAVPMCMLLITSLTSVVFAVLSVRPNITSRKADPEAVKEKKSSLLFFGNFIEMPVETFVEEMNTLKEDQQEVYNNMTIDIYHLGKVLKQKYKLLRFSYMIFMGGLIISVIAFLVVFMISYNTPAPTTESISWGDIKLHALK
jgi:predicted metal-dependent HD superfamily phosphohydrolase